MHAQNIVQPVYCVYKFKVAGGGGQKNTRQIFLKSLGRIF